MIFYIQSLSQQFECFNENVTLVGKQSESSFYLRTNINPNCVNYAGQEMKAVLNFQDVVIPPAMSTVFQTFVAGDNLEVVFVLDVSTYDAVKENPSADFTISFGDQFYYPGTIPVIEHTSLDTRHCWDDVKFSVDRDWAFNISVKPLKCQISKLISVTLQYYNGSWMSIPIIPTAPTGPFSGYKTGDFNTLNVFFFNTSSDGDLVNAEKIINFVEFFKQNLNVKLRFRIEENDLSSSIQLVYQQDIVQYGNALSVVAQPLPTRCTLDTWYCFTTMQNPALVVTAFSTIPGGVSIFCQQYTYDEDKQFENQASFRLPIANFKTRKGITYQYHRTIAINETKPYYYLTFIQLQDANGKMLAGIYYSGQAQKSCFEHMQYQWFSEKVCIKAFFKDNPTCRARFLTNGVVGQFVGQENSPSDPNDPTLRKTFFWMNLNQLVTEAWFGRYNQMCMGEHDGSGTFQGQNMTYGTFSQRIYDLGKYIQAQPTNITVNCWFNSAFELDFITSWSNNMKSRALVWIYPAASGIIILSIVIIVVLWKKQM
ncbi:Conserved_hypothetical protein [Hexamita inflata]|uniref:Transmembrane protein n=1 Tax=Hexamita inflata TaxID=28002 RepID=A0ABP1KJ61_9EUKA